MAAYRPGRTDDNLLSGVSQKYLIAGLSQETDSQVKRNLLLALRNVDDPSATTCDAVIKLIKDSSNEDVKIAGCGTIAFWSNKVTGALGVKLRDELTELLGNGDSANVRGAAAAGLGSMHSTSPGVIAALQKAKKTDTSDTVHRASLIALCNLAIIDDSLLPELTEALKDPDDNIRNATLNVIRRVGPKAAFTVPELLKSNLRIDQKLDSLAATQSDDKEVQAIMMQALDSADDIHNWNQARAAIHYFGQLGPKATAALPALQKVVDGKYPFKYEAREVINKIDGGTSL